MTYPNYNPPAKNNFSYDLGPGTWRANNGKRQASVWYLPARGADGSDGVDRVNKINHMYNQSTHGSPSIVSRDFDEEAAKRIQYAGPGSGRTQTGGTGSTSSTFDNATKRSRDKSNIIKKGRASGKTKEQIDADIKAYEAANPIVKKPLKGQPVPRQTKVLISQAEYARYLNPANRPTKICPGNVAKALPLANLIVDDSKLMQALGATIAGEVPSKLKELGLSNFATKADLVRELVKQDIIDVVIEKKQSFIPPLLSNPNVIKPNAPMLKKPKTIGSPINPGGFWPEGWDPILITPTDEQKKNQEAKPLILNEDLWSDMTFNFPQHQAEMYKKKIEMEMAAFANAIKQLQRNDARSEPSIFQQIIDAYKSYQTSKQAQQSTNWLIYLIGGVALYNLLKK